MIILKYFLLLVDIEEIGKMSKHDRSKSGGLLESIFGRPKTKSKSYYGTISGRPVPTEADVDLQELEEKIKQLTESEVDQKFMEILEDMNIPKDKRAPLTQKPVGEKRDMIFMHLKGKSVGELRLHRL